jgi:hypothetical protein
MATRFAAISQQRKVITNEEPKMSLKGGRDEYWMQITELWHQIKVDIDERVQALEDADQEVEMSRNSSVLLAKQSRDVGRVRANCRCGNHESSCSISVGWAWGST